MKKNEADELQKIIKNLSNVQILLGELFMPITTLQQKYDCSKEQACNIKLKAEEYLTKFGCLTIDVAVKNIKTLTQVITET